MRPLDLQLRPLGLHLRQPGLQHMALLKHLLIGRLRLANLRQIGLLGKETVAETAINGADALLPGRIPAQPKEVPKGRRHLRTNRQNAQAIAARELKMVGEPPADLSPQTGYAEVTLGNCGIVQQDQAAGRYFRQPGVKIAGGRLVIVKAVDMQKVHRPVRHMLQPLGEGTAQQPRKMAVAGGAIFCQSVIGLGAAVTGRIVVPPAVDRKAVRRQLRRLDGLAEGAEGQTAAAAEIHQTPRSRRTDQPEREGNMRQPRHRAGPLGAPEGRKRQAGG